MKLYFKQGENFAFSFFRKRGIIKLINGGTVKWVERRCI